MLVVTCPTVEYLDALVAHPDFTQYYNNQQFGQLTACIIHMTPHEVLQDARYKQWMNLFSDTVQVPLLTRVKLVTWISFDTLNHYIMLRPRTNSDIIAHLGEQTSLLTTPHVQSYCHNADQNEPAQPENIPQVVFTR